MGEMGRHGGDGGWGRVEEGDESEDWSHRRARDDAREARASANGRQTRAIKSQAATEHGSIEYCTRRCKMHKMHTTGDGILH